MLTPLRPGICYGCQSLVWRMALAARELKDQNIVAGQPFLLWPEADTLYAQVRTADGVAPGITFCPDCAPEIGTQLDVLAQPAQGAPYVVSGRVVGLDSAYSRYADWYSDARGAFFRTWLHDALSLEPLEIDKLMSMWESDRNVRHADPDQLG